MNKKTQRFIAAFKSIEYCLFYKKKKSIRLDAVSSNVCRAYINLQLQFRRHFLLLFQAS